MTFHPLMADQVVRHYHEDVARRVEQAHHRPYRSQGPRLALLWRRVRATMAVRSQPRPSLMLPEVRFEE